jgi:hypothetical protein
MLTNERVELRLGPLFPGDLRYVQRHYVGVIGAHVHDERFATRICVA